MESEHPVHDTSIEIDHVTIIPLNDPLPDNEHHNVESPQLGETSLRTRSGRVIVPRSLPSVSRTKSSVHKQDKTNKKSNLKRLEKSGKVETVRKKRRLEEKLPLEEQMRTMTLLRCHLCQKEQHSFRDLKNHMEKGHGQTHGYIFCCDKKYDRRAAFDHMKYHLDREAFKCEVCGKLWTCRMDLLKHRNASHAPPDKFKFNCDACGRDFPTSGKLRLHQKSHLAPEERDFKCPNCPKGFYTKSLLDTHVNCVHRKEVTHFCEVCGKGLCSKSSLDNHLKSHKEVKTEQCDICEKFFFNVKAHKKRLHAEVELVDCSVCEKPIRKHMMANHLRLFHSGQQWKCEVCGKEFKLRKTLKDHMNMHMGVKINCYFCPVQATNSGNLIKHLNQVHPAEYAEFKANRYAEQRVKNQSITSK